MPRSSDSVAGLATALAKAQIELVNPEKSMVATIQADTGQLRPRCFRYAPLSSGLDIIRKILGQHGIAVMQTTGIDAATRMISLTTMLAHGSGEWIASDWPVCRWDDVSRPHRMGAALTYARRYALFALVGIAGEDDLDAPDLNGSPDNGSKPAVYLDSPPSQEWRQRTASEARTSRSVNQVRPNLDADASTAIRDELLKEIGCLPSADAATGWATTAMLQKNRLAAADAKAVEKAFAERLNSFEKASRSNRPDQQPTPKRKTRRSRQETATGSIDKSALALPEPRRHRDKEHLKFVARQPCLVCGRQPSDAHHLRFAQASALGRKVSDAFTVPLCRGHHREVHASGNEAEWWKQQELDPLSTAQILWAQR